MHLNNIYCGRVQEHFREKDSYELITMWDVIEHLPEPIELLRHLHKLLKEEGCLFIHTPNIQVQLPKARIKKALKGMQKDLHYLEARDHIHIYSPITLSALLQKVGFSQIEYIHLKPIQSVSGSKNRVLKSLKNGWFEAAKLIHQLSSGRVNLDNLFVVAKK